MGAGRQALMFLVTGPVVGILAAIAWWIFRFMVFSQGVSGIWNGWLGIAVGAMFAAIPLFWAAMLVAAWRDLGRDRRWLVRNSPLALAGVFILTVVATTRDLFPGT